MRKWLDYCVSKALNRGDDNVVYNLHAVLVKGGSILAQGENKSNSSSSFRVIRPDAPHWLGFHAEIDCIRRATDAHLEGSNLFVAGVNRCGEILKSKPCCWCWDVILRDTCIRKVSYYDRNKNIKHMYANAERL